MSKPLSRSNLLASKLIYAAMCMLRDAGGEMKASDIVDALPDRVNLDEWASEMIESNGLPRWRTYVLFFSVDAVKAGYLLKTKGVWRITPEGIEALKLGETGYFLQARQGYREWKKQQLVLAGAGDIEHADEVPVETVEQIPPEVQFASLKHELNETLAAEILASIKKCSPTFFEQLVVQLLIKMGYGGSREEAGRAVGKSGDGGIDGIINEDRLGLDAIYLQAKRWDGVVGRPEIMKFVGALAGQRANKGVFITTSWYTQEAREYAGNSQYKVVLIDGPRLADLMIEHDLGVSVAATYQLKRIDSDFFADE